MGAPNFWDDTEKAQKIVQERNTVSKVVEGWTDLKSAVEEASVLLEMAEEEGDSELLKEVEEEVSRISDSVSDMEFQKMLSGDHDAGDAIFSINSGAGGTEISGLG